MDKIRGLTVRYRLSYSTFSWRLFLVTLDLGEGQNASCYPLLKIPEIPEKTIARVDIRFTGRRGASALLGAAACAATPGVPSTTTTTTSTTPTTVTNTHYQQQHASFLLDVRCYHHQKPPSPSPPSPPLRASASAPPTPPPLLKRANEAEVNGRAEQAS
ncbi:hypothetical protein M0802_004284 [Mischocyttarus mexicanus]|nr:hypothetical protein M0802_004284 [Mischocyttarus mexicanus]